MRRPVELRPDSGVGTADVGSNPLRYVMEHAPRGKQWAASPAAWSLLMTIAYIVNKRNGFRLFAGDEELAAMSRLSLRSVQRAKPELVELGWLDQTRRASPTNWAEYEFVFLADTRQIGGRTPARLAEVGVATPANLAFNTRQFGDGRPVTPLIEVVEVVKPPETGQKVARRSDELFDALVVACDIDPAELTPDARGLVNRSLKSLRAVGATPGDITSRSANYRRRWPNITLTPMALSKHWAQLKTCEQPHTRVSRSMEAVDEVLAHVQPHQELNR